MREEQAKRRRATQRGLRGNGPQAKTIVLRNVAEGHKKYMSGVLYVGSPKWELQEQRAAVDSLAAGRDGQRNYRVLVVATGSLERRLLEDARRAAIPGLHARTQPRAPRPRAHVPSARGGGARAGSDTARRATAQLAINIKDYGCMHPRLPCLQSSMSLMRIKVMMVM